MPDHSVHKAVDLARDERLLVERWLGRPLSNDETISVNAYRPYFSPAGNDRVWEEILTQAREIGSRVGAEDAAKTGVDDLLDEAFNAVRGRRG